jgi:sugar phosphate isomerase/epimerase
MTSHADIRIGTLVPMERGANYIRQIQPHGFECFALTTWKHIAPDFDLARTAREVVDAVGDHAHISAITLFGNILQDDTTHADFVRCIDACRSFNCDLVAGFAGAIDGAKLTDSMPAFKQVWGDLLRRAEDNGVRIAWETCDMGGTWNNVRWNIAHSPDAWRMMFDTFDSPNVGLQWEPCHQLGALVDPIAQLREWAPTGKIFNVHGKDATIAWDVIRRHGLHGERPYFWHRTPGFGDTNWTDVISILRMHGYRGSIDIEGWHDPAYRKDLEMTGQVHALNYLKRCRGGEFVANPA